MFGDGTWDLMLANRKIQDLISVLKEIAPSAEADVVNQVYANRELVSISSVTSVCCFDFLTINSFRLSCIAWGSAFRSFTCA